MKKFDGKSFLNIFVTMEEQATKHYAELAENAPDDKAKALFERMAKEEKKHKEMYTKLLNKYGDKMEAEFDDEEAEYAELLIKTAVTEKREDDKKKKYGDALKMAEQMERDTLLFVTQMREMYPNVAKKEMKAVLREEKKHLLQVRDRSQFLPTRSLGL